MKKIYVIIVGVVVLLGLIYWQVLAPVSLSDKSVLFQVYSGQGISQIAEQLKAQNLIRSEFAFILAAKFWQLDKNVRIGRFSISPNMNAKEILNVLTDPKRGEVSVTIPEGFSAYDIDDKLVEMGLIMPGEFSLRAATLEGYLFPDTYFVYKTNFDPDSLIKKMRENFLKKLTPNLQQAILKSGRTLQDTIIMASIIEKEARTEKDYKIVSGILWKRLESEWALQADATSLYGKSTTSITSKTLKEDSPYNTRINKGLPPTPICNPGLAAITAAILPEESAYWFYLTDAEGNMRYSKTNDEHNENKKRYMN